MIGLKTCNIDYSHRKIIAIFDSDKEGIDCCNKTTVKYSGSRNKYGLYAITLPKPNATIENYYSKDLFARTGDFSNLITKATEAILKRAKIAFSEQMQKESDSTVFVDFKQIFDLIEEIRKL